VGLPPLSSPPLARPLLFWSLHKSFSRVAQLSRKGCRLPNIPQISPRDFGRGALFKSGHNTLTVVSLPIGLASSPFVKPRFFPGRGDLGWKSLVIPPHSPLILACSINPTFHFPLLCPRGVCDTDLSPGHRKPLHARYSVISTTAEGPSGLFQFPN